MVVASPLAPFCHSHMLQPLCVAWTGHCTGRLTNFQFSPVLAMALNSFSFNVQSRNFDRSRIVRKRAKGIRVRLVGGVGTRGQLKDAAAAVGVGCGRDPKRSKAHEESNMVAARASPVRTSRSGPLRR